MLIEKSNTVKQKKIDFPMSRERYLSSWKIFRSISDENYITAKHLLALDLFQNVKSILDVGCGDGLIAKSISLNSTLQIEKVILIDPDKEMLDEAYIHLTETGAVPEVQKDLGAFEDSIQKYIPKVDLTLAVHLVYLISKESFEYLIDSLPIGKKLIIVLDHKDSIFTKLWNRTAPKYAQRSNDVRTYLSNLSNNYSIAESMITSKLINPLDRRTDIKEALLSLMSYSDFSLMDQESRKFVENCVQENLSGRFVECKSGCYEIIRVK